ncbi:MAG: TetR/AcrR family transcriptional regulator [Acidimicrobiales bacterium]
MGARSRTSPVETAEAESSQAARAPWGTLSRGQIVDAATKMVRAGGYETMTIRSLAADIGVAPMSLYRYVKDKDDLLGEVVDALLGEVWCPRSPESDWRAWIAEAANNLRCFLTGEPAALHVYLSHPVVSKAALARMDEMLRVLGQAGLDQEAALSAYGAIHTYTIGFAAFEASRSRTQGTEQAAGDLAKRLESFASPRQFVEGLGYLLDGVARAAKVDSKRPAHTVSTGSR